MNSTSWLLVGCGVILGLMCGLMMTPIVAVDGVPHVSIWLETVNRICTSFSGLGTLVALIFVVRQFKLLRLQTDLLQKNVAASMDSALYNRLDSFNRFIVEHHKIYELLNTHQNGNEPTEQKAKLHHLCDLGFTFYEEIFKHNIRYQLLHSEDWDEWKANLRHFFEKPYVQGYWKSVSHRYSQSFQKFISETISDDPIRVAA